MAINLNDNINTLAPKPTDNRYGPYASVSSALASISNSVRHSGLTIGVINASNQIIEYWWPSGVSDSHLVVKTSSSSGPPVIDDTVVRTFGDQTIDGTKTFTSGLRIIGSGINMPVTVQIGSQFEIEGLQTQGKLNLVDGELSISYSDQPFIEFGQFVNDPKAVFYRPIHIVSPVSAGDPVILSPVAYVPPGQIDACGAITAGYWRGSPIEVDKGGTGRTSYTDGQLLIGGGNGLIANRLTPGSGINIVNGSGAIAIHFNDLLSIVRTTGNQNISGIKTFFSPPVFASGYSNGQLLIGSGNSLVPNTLSAGTGIEIINGSGNIKISVTGLDLLSNSTPLSGDAGIDISYYSIYDRIIITSTGLSFVGHKHLFEDIHILDHIDLNGYRITGLGAPVSGNDATTKSYVDNLVSSIGAALSFDSNDFSVSNNNVQIKNSGIDNNQLYYSYIKLGSTTISLGSAQTVVGGLDLDGGSP